LRGLKLSTHSTYSIHFEFLIYKTHSCLILILTIADYWLLYCIFMSCMAASNLMILIKLVALIIYCLWIYCACSIIVFSLSWQLSIFERFECKFSLLVIYCDFVSQFFFTSLVSTKRLGLSRVLCRLDRKQKIKYN
jgi:hypothetical protein